MNKYEWMADAEPEEPPMHEADSREDPAHRPQVPTEDDESRELHSTAGGGRDQVTTGHHVEHTMADPQETVSQEGVIESVRKLIGVHNRGKGFKSMEEVNPYSIRGYLADIEKTFASEEWLGKQTPVKGDINASGISEYINPNDLIGTLKKASSSMTQIVNALGEASRKFHTQIKPALTLIGPDCKLTDEAYESLKQALDETKPLSELYRGPAKLSIDTGNKVDSLPPIPIDQIPAVAKELVACFVNFNHVIDDYIAIGKSINPALNGQFIDVVYADRDHGEGFSFKTKGGYKEDAWAELGQKLARKINIAQIPAYENSYVLFTKVLHAVALYMDRSIKGGKPTVSNEGIFDMIKSIFGSKPKDLDIDYIGTGIDKEFARTLFDQKWLEKQTFTEGTVSFKFPKAAASGDYPQLCKQVEAELSATAEKNAAVVKAYYAKTLPAFAAMDVSIINRKIEDIQKLRDLVVYDDMDFNIKWHEPKNITEPEVEVKLPALDEAGVKKAAEAILHLLELLTTYQNKCVENVPGAPKIKWQDLVSQIKDDTKRPLIQEYYEDLESINDYGIECFFQRNDNYWYMVGNLTAGLMRWIAKSVTGINYS